MSASFYVFIFAVVVVVIVVVLFVVLGGVDAWGVCGVGLYLCNTLKKTLGGDFFHLSVNKTYSVNASVTHTQPFNLQTVETVAADDGGCWRR